MKVYVYLRLGFLTSDVVNNILRTNINDIYTHTFCLPFCSTHCFLWSFITNDFGFISEIYFVYSILWKKKKGFSYLYMYIRLCLLFSDKNKRKKKLSQTTEQSYYEVSNIGNHNWRFQIMISLPTVVSTALWLLHCLLLNIDCRAPGLETRTL